MYLRDKLDTKVLMMIPELGPYRAQLLALLSKKQDWLSRLSAKAVVQSTYIRVRAFSKQDYGPACNIITDS